MKKTIIVAVVVTMVILSGCASKSDVQNLQVQMDQVKVDQTRLESSVTAQNQALGNHESRLNALDGEVSALQKDLVNFKNKAFINAMKK